MSGKVSLWIPSDRVLDLADIGTPVGENGPGSRNECPSRRLDEAKTLHGPGGHNRLSTSVAGDFDDGRGTHATASAHRRHTDSASSSLQLVYQRHQHSSSGHGNGVPQAAPAAIRIPFVRIATKPLSGAHTPRRERFVDLEEVAAIERQASTRQSLRNALRGRQTRFGRRNRSEEHTSELQ